MLSIIKNDWNRLMEEKEALIFSMVLVSGSVLLAVLFSAGNSGRRIGTNIIGYMMMFLLMQGVSWGKFFAEDKERHQIERIVASPMTIGKYLTAHGIFMWMLIFLPSMLVIAICDLLGIGTGFHFWQYGILIGMLCALAVCFSIFVNSFFKVSDTANMVGSSVVVLSSVLAGSFYDMSNKTSLFAKFLYVFPQKGFMQFMDALEKQNLNQTSWVEMIYVIIITILFLAAGAVKTRRDYIYHRG